MRYILLFASVCSVIVASNAFSFPFIGGNIQVKRHSIVDLDSFRNATYKPEVGLTFAKYESPFQSRWKPQPKKPTAIFISGIEFSALSLAQYANTMRRDYNLVYLCCSSSTSETHPVVELTVVTTLMIWMSHAFLIWIMKIKKI